MRRILLAGIACVLCGMGMVQATAATIYHVAMNAPAASDDNPGTAAKPWKTLARAAGAQELQPGDTVLVHAGVYREEMMITRSGEQGSPLTFAAAPGERVVIKGSDVIKGPWTRVGAEPNMKEPYPNAFTRVWKVKLGDEYFPGPANKDHKHRYVSTVFQNDGRALQEIGPDHIYNNAPYFRLPEVGRDLSDLFEGAFYFDAPTQTLYVDVSGDPAWYLMEVGTRQWTLVASKVHDVVIRGFEMRQNRQPGGQWPMANISDCERVTMEDCRVSQADFCGLGIGRDKDCVVRDCVFSHNGDTGLGMSLCRDCRIENCILTFNNTRRFSAGWHCGGMKCIPQNVHCTVSGCEVAYNIDCPGIWFDSQNADNRMLNNVVHDNGGPGIMYEINKGGGLIAGNLIYRNGERGIYISGSQKVWIVNNTLAENNCGIVCMPREGDWTLENTHILNNLLLSNDIAGPTGPRGCDLTLFMGPDENGPRTVMSNHSDYNFYASGFGIPTLRQSWNPDNTLAVWQKRYGEDMHSQSGPISWEVRDGRFRLLDPDAERKLAFATPLPKELNWQPKDPARVGCDLTAWPVSTALSSSPDNSQQPHT